jgi:hypothetical protein
MAGSERADFELPFTVVLGPNQRRATTVERRVPLGQVWQIVKVTCFDRPSADFELALLVNENQLRAIPVSKLLSGNKVKFFSTIRIGTGCSFHFVATPLGRVTNRIYVEGRLKIHRTKSRTSH